MTQREKEILLLKKAERAGVPINWAAAEREFGFAVSTITTYGVDSAILTQLGKLVSDAAEQKNFSCQLKAIIVFPMITDLEIFARKDFKTHKVKDSGYFVGKNIDFDAWKNAKRPRRIALATANLKLSIQDIPDRHLSPDQKEQILILIDAASKVLLEKLKRKSQSGVA